MCCSGSVVNAIGHQFEDEILQLYTVGDTRALWPRVESNLHDAVALKADHGTVYVSYDDSISGPNGDDDDDNNNNNNESSGGNINADDNNNNNNNDDSSGGNNNANHSNVYSFASAFAALNQSDPTHDLCPQDDVYDGDNVYDGHDSFDGDDMCGGHDFFDGDDVYDGNAVRQNESASEWRD